MVFLPEACDCETIALAGVLFGDEMPNDAAVSYCGVPAREIVTFIRVRAVMVF